MWKAFTNPPNRGIRLTASQVWKKLICAETCAIFKLNSRIFAPSDFQRCVRSHLQQSWARCRDCELSTLTGFSADAIKDYERPDKVIDANARKRYRLACAAVEFGIDEGWSDRVLKITRPIHIRMIRDEE